MSCYGCAEAKGGQGDEVSGSCEEVVVLFDNTYSWLTSKLLRYDMLFC